MWRLKKNPYRIAIILWATELDLRHEQGYICVKIWWHKKSYFIRHLTWFIEHYEPLIVEKK